MNAPKNEPDQDLTPIILRLSPDELSALDAWIDRHGPEVTRAQAIRRLVRSILAPGDGARIETVDEGLHPEELTSQNDD